MKNLFILLFLCVCCCLHLQAQVNCPKYTTAIRAGKAFLNKKTPDFDKALIEFQAAQIAARECGLEEKAGKVAAKEIKKVFEGLRKQRDKAIKNERRAKTAEQQATAALTQVKVEQQKTTTALATADSLNTKNKKLIDAFYFYDGKFALANKGRYYGFINKEGEELIGYKYRAAQQFDQETGFAKVKKGFTNRAGEETLSDYLIDTTGQEFPVAYRMEDLAKNITALDLRDYPLDTFPMEIIANPQLKIIILDQNSVMRKMLFINLPKEINQLTELEFLSVRHCRLTALPEGMEQLSKLRYLNLSTNKELSFTAICRAFADSDLKINITNNRHSRPTHPDILLLIVPPPSHLPPEIGQLRFLESLDLSASNIPQIPSEIGQLVHLKHLDLGRNKLSEIPPEIGQLTALKTLDLSNNQLNKLAPEITQLKTLETLDVGHNQLTALPSEIGQLNLLKVLNLRDNQFEQLAPEIGQLHQLKELSLNKNQLTTLPPEIGQLNKLEKLSLFSNPIHHLPAEIVSLTNLQTLQLGGKKIKTIPDGIFNLNLDERSWRSIRSPLIHHKNYTQAYQVIKKLIDIDSSNFTYHLRLSFYALFVERPKEAIAAAQKTLDLNPKITGAYPNLALGYLVNNQYIEAEKICLKWKDYIFSNQKSFTDILLEGIADLEAANIHHANFEKIKKRLKE